MSQSIPPVPFRRTTADPEIAAIDRNEYPHLVRALDLINEAVTELLNRVDIIEQEDDEPDITLLGVSRAHAYWLASLKGY